MKVHIRFMFPVKVGQGRVGSEDGPWSSLPRYLFLRSHIYSSLFYTCSSCSPGSTVLTSSLHWIRFEKSIEDLSVKEVPTTHSPLYGPFPQTFPNPVILVPYVSRQVNLKTYISEVCTYQPPDATTYE